VACSFCKQNGHDKRQCPIKKEEKIKIQRDRLNMAIQVLPVVMNNPIFQALAWWQISKRNKVLDFTNKLIVAQEATGLLELGGASFMADVNPVDLPEGVVLGAIIQEVEDTQEFISWGVNKTKAKKEQAEQIIKDVIQKTKETTQETKGAIAQHGYETGSSEWVRELEEGTRYFLKYGEVPPQLLEKYKFW
jgi:transcription termination factor NusB